MEADPPECQSKPFSTHSKEGKTWGTLGSEIMASYLAKNGTFCSLRVVLR